MQSMRTHPLGRFARVELVPALESGRDRRPRWRTSECLLALILKEWLLSSSFSARMTAIQNGTDLLAGTGIHFGADTVFPDGLANVTPGPGNNWIIA
jgi:hypothetical protein